MTKHSNTPEDWETEILDLAMDIEEDGWELRNPANWGDQAYMDQVTRRRHRRVARYNELRKLYHEIDAVSGEEMGTHWC